MTTKPLMPKATAVWLVENTKLTFQQIADFTGLHELEVQALADGETVSIRPLDPVASHQLTAEEIKRCEADGAAQLKLATSKLPKPKARTKGPRYTPISKRGDKPDAVAWVLKNHPELSDAQVCKLIGTTKNTIEKIRDRSHWNMANIKARHPVEIGLCSHYDLEQMLKKVRVKPVAVASNSSQVVSE